MDLSDYRFWSVAFSQTAITTIQSTIAKGSDPAWDAERLRLLEIARSELNKSIEQLVITIELSKR